MADLSVFNLSKNRAQPFKAFSEGRDRRRQREIDTQNLARDEIQIENLRKTGRGADLQNTGQELQNAQAEQQMYVDLARQLQRTDDEQLLPTVQRARQRFQQIPNVRLGGLDEIEELIRTGQIDKAREGINSVADSGGGRDVQGRTPTVLKKTGADGEVTEVPGVIITYKDGTTETVEEQAPEGTEFSVESPATRRAEQQRIRYEDAENAFRMHKQQSVYDSNAAVEKISRELRATGMANDMVEVVSSLDASYTAKRQASQLLDLMQRIETGGVGRIADYFQDVFGFRPVDEVAATNLMKQQGMLILQQFTGAKSDDERKFALSMGPSFSANNEGNIALTNLLIESLDQRIRAGEAARAGKDSWDTYLNQRSSEAGASMSDTEVIEAVGGADMLQKYMSDNNLSRIQSLDELRQHFLSQDN